MAAVVIRCRRPAAGHRNGRRANGRSPLAARRAGLNPSPRMLPFARSFPGAAMNEADSHWTAQRKTALVLDLLQGETTMAMAAAQFQLTPERIQGWLDAGRQGITQAMQAETEPAGPARGDLRDLIPRPFADHGTVTVTPEELLNTAWQRMRAHDVSQLPVMEGERIVGMLDESDVLLHVYGDEARFTEPVSAAMVSRLDKVDVHAPLEALLPVFDRGHVAIVMDAGNFLGLITRIDLLNHLRRRVG